MKKPLSKSAKEVFAYIKQWGGEKPTNIEAEVWMKALRELERAGRIHYERGWRVLKKRREQ